jgi:hypothetical protein
VSQTSYYPNPPIVSVDPMGTDQVFAGTTVSYAVTVTNPDLSVTYPAFYENSMTPPDTGWIVSWDSVPKSILVDPGATEVIDTLRVISPNNAPPGIYSIDLVLTNETGSAGSVTTITSFPYEVLPHADTTPPPPPSGLFGTPYPSTGHDYVVLEWTPPADESDVFGYEMYRNGVMYPTGTNLPFGVDYNYSALVSNAYVVRSVDLAGNVSTPSPPWQLGVAVPSLGLPGLAALVGTLFFVAGRETRPSPGADAHSSAHK